MNINVGVDKRLLPVLNAPDAFSDNIKNSRNIGKTSRELTEIWNEEHPEDPIQN